MSAAEVTLLHTNDMHDRRHVFPYLAERPRDARTLLLDAGDAIGGSNTVFRRHEPILDLMGQVGYDAMAFGNRELSYFRGILRRRHAQAKFPFICANVRDLRGQVNELWQPTLEKQVGGVRIGVIGLTPVQYLPGSPWQPIFGYRFWPAMEVLPDRVRELRSRVDLLILLSHQGYKADRHFAEHVAGIDVIVGGHSHHLLERPVRVGGAWIVQTGCFARFVGEMRLRVGSAGVELVDYALIPMAGAEPVPADMRRAS